MRRYVPTDLGEMNEWYRAREMPPVEPDALPHVGFIEPGICAGFLFATDSSVALLEGYISNPHAGSDDRDRALEAITKALTDAAREAGFRRLLVLTQSWAVEERAKRHGFEVIGGRRLLRREVSP